jgi:hypothetical protein
MCNDAHPLPSWSARIGQAPTCSQELGFSKPQVLIGSIGAPESRVEINHAFPSLAALEAVWAKLNDPRMAEYQKDLAPFVAPGSHRWEVFRVQEV